MTQFNYKTGRSGLALVLIGCLGLTACASQPERRGPPSDRDGQDRPVRTSGTFVHPVAILFSAMDVDRDKNVSRGEMEAGAKMEWAQFGTNPGAVRLSEWSLDTLGSTDAQPTFMSFDQDFNGVVSETEFIDRLENEFARLDKNRDNILERSEMVIAFQAPQGQSRQRGNGQQQGGRGEGGQRGEGRPPR